MWTVETPQGNFNLIGEPGDKMVIAFRMQTSFQSRMIGKRPMGGLVRSRELRMDCV